MDAEEPYEPPDDAADSVDQRVANPLDPKAGAPEAFAERRQEAIDRGTYTPGEVRMEDGRNALHQSTEHPEGWRYTEVPSAQRAVEASYAREGVSRATLAEINPVDGRDGRDANCGECSRAVANLLEGQPDHACLLAPATDGAEGERLNAMETWIGSEQLDSNMRGRDSMPLSELRHDQVDQDVELGFVELEDDLRRAGPGSHAVVYVMWKPSAEADQAAAPDAKVVGTFGHWFNVRNDNHRILYIDSQPDPPIIAEANSPEAEEYRREAMEMSWARADRRRP